MPDGDVPHVSSARRLADLLRRVREAQQEALAKTPPLTDKVEQVEFIQARTAIYALTVTDALLESFIEQNLTSIAARKHGGQTGDKSPTFWDLDETLILAYRDGPKVKPLSKFTIEDGDQLSAQKNTNVVSAIRSRKLWEWQWNLIRPLLVSHKDWVFEDAFNDLESRGLPTPPDLDE